MGILKEADLPERIRKVVGERHSKRIGAMVRDLIVETLSANDGNLHIGEEMLEAITDLRTFLFDKVYSYYKVHDEFVKAQRIISDLYLYFLENGIVRLRNGAWEHGMDKESWEDKKTAHRKVCDYVAGMTDRYALSLYKHIFLPEPWSVK